MRYRKQLKDIVKAWESLSEGNHSVNVVQNWLVDKMKPAIDNARETLNEVDKNSLPERVKMMDKLLSEIKKTFTTVEIQEGIEFMYWNRKIKNNIDATSTQDGMITNKVMLTEIKPGSILRQIGEAVRNNDYELADYLSNQFIRNKDNDK